MEDDTNLFRAHHGWFQSSVTIPLVKERVSYPFEDNPSILHLKVDNVYHWSIVDIMESVFSEHVSSTFHFTPFEQCWTTADGHCVHVYSKAYSSQQMLDAFNEVNALPRDPGDDYEQVVAPLMLWSDATQLVNFGDASLWPIYLFFGNQSKYTCRKPTSGAGHHVAYIPSVSFPD